ncbi:unnamed protein product, partial [Sphacelaria rigidula]
MQNGDAATMPGTHEDLRTALRTVNLRKWLPELLCRDGGGHSGEGSCNTLVETALSHVAEPTAAVTVFGATSSVTVTAAMGDVPWMQVLEECQAHLDQLQPYECGPMGTVMAIERGTKQILPALRCALKTTRFLCGRAH